MQRTHLNGRFGEYCTCLSARGWWIRGGGRGRTTMDFDTAKHSGHGSTLTFVGSLDKANAGYPAVRLFFEADHIPLRHWKECGGPCLR